MKTHELLAEFLIDFGFPEHSMIVRNSFHLKDSSEIRVFLPGSGKISIIVGLRAEEYKFDCAIINGDKYTPWNEEYVTHWIHRSLDIRSPDSLDILSEKLKEFFKSQKTSSFISQ